MNIAILNINGEETGKSINLRDDIFGIEPNDHAIYLDVKGYLASQRQGTHKSKQRNEVSGSTRKIKRQKGTGTARAGSIKSPVFRGGGRMFGPQPRDYSFKLNKKVKQLARKSALAYKAKTNNITVVEDFTVELPKTKIFAGILAKLNLEDKKTLFILPETNKNVVLSSRNIEKANVKIFSDINTYELMNSEKVVFCEGSIEKLESLFN